MKEVSILDTLKQIGETAAVLISWSLAVAGGSVLAIVSTSYNKPLKVIEKTFYLLFIPGWILLFCSVYQGNQIKRRIIAAHYAKDEKILKQINEAVNNDFDTQLTCFQIGIFIFGVWLILYLLWWMFADRSIIKVS
jgi:hypothetical protein